MIDWFCSAWHDFWHVMWMMRLGYVFSGMLVAPVVLWIVAVLLLGKNPR